MNKTNKLPMLHPTTLLGICAVLLLGLAQGCNSGNSTADKSDADMRKNMTRKNWSINDVPADKRAMVEAFMKQSQSGGPPKPIASPAAAANSNAKASQ